LCGLNNGAHRAQHPGAGPARIMYRGVLLSRSPERAHRGGSAESGATQRAALHLQGLQACCSAAVALPSCTIAKNRRDSVVFSYKASASMAPSLLLWELLHPILLQLRLATTDPLLGAKPPIGGRRAPAPSWRRAPFRSEGHHSNGCMVHSNK
jgi:hypothetical protein